MVMKTLNKKDNKITLITLNISMLEYENRLTDTAIEKIVASLMKKI